MSILNNNLGNDSVDHLIHKQPRPKSQINASSNGNDIKRYYYKLINEEFRNLQLDPDLKSKSLFDLIDYCELLYEELSNLMDQESGLKRFVKGYLIFNYFINSLIMMYFDGFDEFIRTNERDFIIYLHLFVFYNTYECVTIETHSIPIATLKDWIIEYLVSKELLNFDVNVLYTWLYEYIDYLKRRDEYDLGEQEEHENQKPILTSKGVYNLNSNLYSSSVSLKAIQYPLDISSGSEDNESINHFIDRYPPLHLKSMNDSIESLEFQAVGDNDNRDKSSISIPLDNAPPMPLFPPPIPTLPSPVRSEIPKVPSIPPPIPPGPSLSQPSDLSYQLNSDLNHRNNAITPYPFDIKKEMKDTPYPLSNNTSTNSLYFNNPILESCGNEKIDENKLNNNRYQNIDNIMFHEHSENAYSKYNRPQPKIPPLTSISSPSISESNGMPIPHNQTINQQSNQARPTMPNPQSNGSYNNSVSPYSARSQQSYPGPPPHAKIPQYVVSQQTEVKKQKLHHMTTFSICGLKNFGSSCYINLTIQLLFGLHQFKSIFASLRYVQYIKDPKFIRILKSLQNSKSPILLSEAISGLLKSFHLHGGAAIAPTKFLRISSLLKPDFNIPSEQQDAQEFLLFILERLHDELSYKDSDERELDSDSLDGYILKWNININMKDKENYLKWYKSLIKSEGNSPINDLFQGHLQNKLICNKCGYESINYSPFTILSLPIPNNHNDRVNLSDCLRYYTQDEILTGDNAWHCPKCFKDTEDPEKLIPNTLDNHPVFVNKRSGIFKLGRRGKSPTRDKVKPPSLPVQDGRKESISIKRLNFIKLPQVLFIHLSRFSMFNLTDKLNKVIKYPLQLKFNNYSNNVSHEITYKLVGLINHYGNLKSGHYTALINKSTPSSNLDDMKHPCWCYFDDDSVRINLRHGDINQPNTDFNELNSRDVYVLCYERT